MQSHKNPMRAALVFALFAAALTAQASPPSIVSNGTVNVTENSASISLSVNPQGLSTSYYVEYGPATSFAQKSATASFTSNTSLQQIVTITGLDPRTIYSFRAVATNSDGSKTTAT